MKSLKKFALATMTCAALLGFAATSHAAYQLSDEVKTATPALLMATEIGVKSNTNAALANLPDKSAIVVMSFGTTFKDTRAKTIDATVEAIKAAHPGVKVVTAFTSHIIIDRIKANEGITYPTPEEALAQLKKEGYSCVAMTSLDIIPGMEYAYKDAVYQMHKNDFKHASFGTPLMYWQGQGGHGYAGIAFLFQLCKGFLRSGIGNAFIGLDAVNNDVGGKGCNHLYTGMSCLDGFHGSINGFGTCILEGGAEAHYNDGRFVGQVGQSSVSVGLYTNFSSHEQGWGSSFYFIAKLISSMAGSSKA